MADIISTSKAADRLQTSVPTVRALLEANELAGFKETRRSRFVWRIETSSVDAYLAAHGPFHGVRRASRARMAGIEKEIASLRALVEAGLPSDAGLDRLQQDRDDQRAQVVTLSEALARGRTVAEFQTRADEERAAVNEHLLAAMAASGRADDLRRAAISELEEAVAASSRAGHAGALRAEGDAS
jgi:excisionase family DNA binding protein